jgi:hypothetical protein
MDPPNSSAKASLHLQITGDISKCGQNVVGLVSHLRVGEPQRRQTRSDMGLVTDSVTCLLSSGTVVPKTVGLDDQP